MPRSSAARSSTLNAGAFRKALRVASGGRSVSAAVLALVLGLSGLGAGPALAQGFAFPRPQTARAGEPGDAGAYMAARAAALERDHGNALPFLERMLSAEPADRVARESLITAQVAVGDIARAAQLAAGLMGGEANAGSGPGPISALALTADAFAREDYARVLEMQGQGLVSTPLLDALAAAWAQLGQGRMTEAQEALDQAESDGGFGPFAQYCRALMLALAGDMEGAAALIEQGEVQQALNRRGMIAYLQLLGQLERFDEALGLIDENFAPGADPQINAIRTAFEAAQPVPFDLITSPAQGMADVYAVVAAAMLGPQGNGEALLFAQSALAINPRLSDARLMVGQLHQESGRLEPAAEAFAAISAEDGYALAAAMGRAQVLEAMDRLGEAIEVLEAARRAHPQSLVAAQVLGDFLRQAGRHEEAVASYDVAAAMAIEDGGLPDWRLLFSRAVAHERQGQWPDAEADFRAALEQQPEQPTVLNYLGYSLVERGEKLDEALDMIERAVAGDPESGYITDSLAWAFYRLGRYEEALAPMERAVELVPSDPVLNDHLGDIYWALGRPREAEFQWRRALSFPPGDDLQVERVRRKLEVGLDQVLVEEGAPPLHPSE